MYLDPQDRTGFAAGSNFPVLSTSKMMNRSLWQVNPSGSGLATCSLEQTTTVWESGVHRNQSVRAAGR